MSDHQRAIRFHYRPVHEFYYQIDTPYLLRLAAINEANYLVVYRSLHCRDVYFDYKGSGSKLFASRVCLQRMDTLGQRMKL